MFITHHTASWWEEGVYDGPIHYPGVPIAWANWDSKFGDTWLRKRTMVDHVSQFLDFADKAESDRVLVMIVSRAVQHLHPFDPIDVLGLPVAACYRANGDPRRAILMAVNDRTWTP